MDSDAEKAAQRAALSYRVLLWDNKKERVERLLAVAASASIGYAAFYAATREFPDRHIVLMNEGRTITTWKSGPASTA
ncbi:MAG TPA: hypothetical protein VJ783_23770 [Pirellulales bacterium]|nr:hypothetical protein [Pirellulales bacterium]